jgi:non-heme chloroperoxidase
MRMSRQWIGIVVMLLGSMLHAQDIAGDWQGTLRVGAQDLRLIVNFDKAVDGKWSATLRSIDQGPDWGAGIPANSVTLQGSNLNFTIEALRGSYNGSVGADGGAIEGTWTQGHPLPLEFRRATRETAWKDPSPHTVQFVTVDTGPVRLEVLDWGGSGRPLVLLAGLGNTAHIFDKFAPKLTTSHHVYGITRRGFGASSAPPPSAAAYSADRLGDDVLAVIDGLKWNRPVLAAHSLGGEELSSIGSRHPERVAGLIYLEAGYSYAYYDRARGDLGIDLIYLQKKLERLQPGNSPLDLKPLIEELLSTTLPGFERDLKEMQKNLPEAGTAQPASAAVPPITRAIMTGMQKYTDIRVPVLAI